MAVVRYAFLLLPFVFASCAGSSTTPTAADPSTGGYRGEAVNAIGGAPISGISAKIGTEAALTDDRGYFEISSLKAGSETLVLSGASIVERQKTVQVPGSEISREALIPAAFDLAAFDEMFRGTGRLQRWTTAPALVVLGKVMQYDTFSTDEFNATSEALTQAELDLLIAHLTEALALLTGNTFTSFASIEIDSPAEGVRVNSIRPGKIVVGRYRGVQSLANTIGYGRFAAMPSGEITGGAIYLDRNFDRAEEARRLLRIHEMGHALGYLHVTGRTSIMNPAIGPQPTDFDRQAAQIAFQRQPGNVSPDSDVTSTTRPGGIFGVTTISAVP